MSSDEMANTDPEELDEAEVNKILDEDEDFDHVLWDLSEHFVPFQQKQNLFVRTSNPLVRNPAATASHACRRLSTASQTGVFQWDVLIANPGRGYIFIGLLDGTRKTKSYYENKSPLGHKDWGWSVRSDDGKTYHNRRERNARFYSENFNKKNCRVTVHVDMNQRTCAFTIDGYYWGVAWNNLPDVVMPAISCSRFDLDCDVRFTTTE